VLVPPNGSKNGSNVICGYWRPVHLGVAYRGAYLQTSLCLCRVHEAKEWNDLGGRGQGHRRAQRGPHQLRRAEGVRLRIMWVSVVRRAQDQRICAR
jgi:hypothetical protein